VLEEKELDDYEAKRKASMEANKKKKK